ncbi:Stp1/IreP family PP2C-type Ser/Thr phosphatase [Candidatus Viridilinea mediisalina]|uniref:Protein phosphatase n=1 Tax=Candidatus Viridilinea mediisalina TaxID=2024553 RepID=A0A2A6RPA0_9CHLR|nr:Stp1/IreP family PP2C-type Ser/Thr phosphatase [Candidatus Viridilinea mediisalina]PDW04773.1 protein phosphatase [Candidatus Viridilinea mediisalina]
MRVRFSARTHVGQRREVNQDAFDGGPRGPATLLVVCDGMGGHAAGEVASQLAVTTIMEVYDPAAAEPGSSLRDAFTTANQRVYTQGRGTMGTTGVAALFQHNHLYVANVGDSRAYIVREGQISQISNDHSFVSDQVAAGLMTAEQARHSNIRNIITRALGHSADVNVDIFERELQAGDTVLLSSDGMHGLIEDAEIAEIASIATPDEATQRLVDLANERGGIDNITVVIAQVDELDASAEPSATIPPSASPPKPPAPPSPQPKTEPPLNRLGLLLASLVLLLLISIGAFVLLTASPTVNSAPTITPLATVEATP